jgi:hypothetical protein
VTTIVLHTAEGATTYQSLGSYFQNPASGVSSHVGIDDTPNTVGEYVRRDGKAWTAGNANPWSIQAELCAFAAWTPAEWAIHPQLLANCAAWIAEEAQVFGIPIRQLTPAEAQAGVPGVCQHVDLGSMGGGHWDCGPGFPYIQVLAMAGGGPPVNLEEDLVTSYFANNTHHVYAQQDDGTVVHWWLDLGTRPPVWNVETLPAAA